MSLPALLECGAVSELDVHYARFLARLACDETPELLLAAALCSQWRERGHVCLDLSRLSADSLYEDTPDPMPVSALPEAGAWTEHLRRSPVVGAPGAFTPLVLDERGRLYLNRYFEYEQQLAAAIRRWAQQPDHPVDADRTRRELTHLFADGGDEVDWQRVAALTALLRPFCVVSGGPGTGKTATVLRILALLRAADSKGGHQVALAAPTGKAAARLQSAMADAEGKGLLIPAGDDGARHDITTIHRLLGTRPGSTRCRYHHDRRLPYDTVIVDEASMVDVALMARLVEALPEHARLVLVGDKDQLASVEAGALFADICGPAATQGYSPAFAARVAELSGDLLEEQPLSPPSRGDMPRSHARAPRRRPGEALAKTGTPLAHSVRLRDSMVLLRRNYRFGDDSGIGQLARAINAGRAGDVLDLLRRGAEDSVSWTCDPLQSRLAEYVGVAMEPLHQALLQADSPEHALSVLNRFRVLCAHRAGPWGVRRLNAAILRHLRIPTHHVWYPGRPVMVTENDHGLRLYNGDTGVVLHDTSSGTRVFFRRSDGTVADYPPARLPAHETVYATTVHKAQGSEFDEILLVLPDRVTPVLSRELLYTAVTRARQRVAIWARPDVLTVAVERPVERMSGLRDALWT